MKSLAFLVPILVALVFVGRAVAGIITAHHGDEFLYGQVVCIAGKTNTVACGLITGHSVAVAINTKKIAVFGGGGKLLYTTRQESH